MTSKTLIIAQQIARLRVQGIRDGVIAAKIGMSQSGLSRILATPEYQEIEQAVLTGVLDKMDEHLANNVEAMNKYVQTAVPAALRTLVEATLQRRDLGAAIRASSELLDRDPEKRFTKNAVAGSSTTAGGIPAELLKSVAADADKTAIEVNKTGAVN